MTLTLGGLCCSAGLVAHWLLVHQLWQAVLAQIVLGLGCSFVFTPQMAVVADYFDKVRLGKFLAKDGCLHTKLMYIANTRKVLPCPLSKTSRVWNMCFLQHVRLALVMFSIGASLGLVVVCPLGQRLMDTYDYQSAMLLLGALALHLVPIGMIMRPNTRFVLTQDDDGEKHKEQEQPKQRVNGYS